MFARVAAMCCAAFLFVWPATAGIEVGVDYRVDVAVSIDQPRFQDSAQRPAQDQEQEREQETGKSTREKSGSDDVAMPDLQQDKVPDKATDIVATLEPDQPAAPTERAPAVAEPFGLAASPVAFGDILTKWARVKAEIRADNEILARCRDNAASCPEPARDFLDIIAAGRAQTGRARIGVINRAINLAIIPTSDLEQWGVPDHWSAPLETFTTHRGDCEDYAIAKYVALNAAGVAQADLRLVVVHNTAVDEAHAVVAVRLDGNWIMLDNRWLTLVADNKMARAIPLFVLDQDGVRELSPVAVSSARRTSAVASLNP